MKYQNSFYIQTNKREGLYDITEDVKMWLRKINVQNGLLHLFARGATAAMMIQENWDESVQNDVIHYLKKNIPPGIWEHDQQDGNADAHIKSGLIGPSESIPIKDGQLGLSTWQNIFFCEFDGPREKREIFATFIPLD